MAVYNDQLFINYFDTCESNGFQAYDGTTFTPMGFMPRAQHFNRDMMKVHDGKLFIIHDGVDFKGFKVYDGSTFTDIPVPGHSLSVSTESYTAMEVSNDTLFFFKVQHDDFFKLGKVGRNLTASIAIEHQSIVSPGCLYGMKNYYNSLYLFLSTSEQPNQFELYSYKNGNVSRIGLPAGGLRPNCNAAMEVFDCKLYLVFGTDLYTWGQACVNTEFPDVPRCIPNFTIQSRPSRGLYYLNILRDPCNLETPFPFNIDIINANGNTVCTRTFRLDRKHTINLRNQKPGEYILRVRYGNEVKDVMVTLSERK
ncbi:MAG: hypothetical protein ACFCUU_01340 [Cyclobacteriaceae bacterium]